MKKFNILLAVFTLLSTFAFPQVVQQIESFESATIFPAPGWRNQKYITNVNGAFVLQPAASATNPACGSAPGGGLNLMMFNSFVGTNNDTSIIITKPFDFSNNGGTNPQFSFYMYRDIGFAGNDDHIRVYINTAPNMTGATLLSNTLGADKMSRYYNTAPASTANTWNLYTYDLAAASYTAKRYYFIIMGVCKDGNNIYMDRVTTNTYPSATLASDVKMDLFLQNGASVGESTNNHMIVGLRCIIGGTSGCGVVNGALSTAVKLDSLLMNTNGTTNVLDIDDAKIYYTGGSTLFDSTYVSPFPVTAGTDDYPVRRFGQTIAVPGTNLDFVNGATSCMYLEYDTTYFWLTYDIKVAATSNNFVDADLRSSAVGGTAGTCPSPGGTGVTVTPSAGGFSLPGASQIGLPYCIGSYTHGTSGNVFSYTNNDYIQSVVLNGASGTAINTSVGSTNNNTGLPSNLPCLVSNGGAGCDFTAHPPDYELWDPVAGRTVVLTQGAAYSIAVQAGTWLSNNNIAVFIDYNRDGDFIDAGEKLGQVNCGANQTLSIPFVTPAAGYTGLTRMRVREVFASSNIDPCSQQNYGEIEDFNIVISPNCPIGYKLWLGNTDDWNSPGNWCGGVPTITEDAFVDRLQVFPPAGIATRPYFCPTIKSTVGGNANNLTISSLDSLIIDAPNASANALKLRKDIINNGTVKVINSLTKNLKYGNGTIINNIYSPLKAQSTDARTQIIYSYAELELAGLMPNDNITGLQFSLNFKGSTAAFGGFSVSYALVPFSQHSSNVPYAGPFTTVYGPVALTTTFPGINTINLSTPIVWDGLNNLLIQYCFDNTANIGSNDDRISITQTTGVKSTLILSSTTNAGAGCAMIPGAGVTDNFFSGLYSFRPNFTFLINRPYGKAIINVQEDWLNNGFFEAGYSRVRMDSTIAQTIAGSQPTTFNELEINKGAASQFVTMMRAITVDSSVVLLQGQLRMNTYTLTMNNPRAMSTNGNLVNPKGPFERTNGFLISENATASVIWKNINSVIGYRVVPFGSGAVTAPLYIPFSFLHKSGDMGDMDISTYNAPGNLPLPPTVTHINNLTGTNNAAGAVDRYWILSKTGANPVADIMYRFTTAERAAGMSAFNQGKAQPYRTTPIVDLWLRLTTPYTTSTYTQSYGTSASPAYDSVRVTSWDWPVIPTGPSPYFEPASPIGNSNPWLISLNNSPCGYGPNSALSVNGSITHVTCPGGNDGAIVLTVTGGVSPYAYLWNNGSVSANLSNLTAGTYTVTVTDANGLTASASFTLNVLNQPPAPLGSINGSASVCAGASNITFTVPTSLGATNYQWTIPAKANIVSGNGTNVLVVNFASHFTSGVLCVTASNVCGTTAPACLNLISNSGIPSTPSTITGSALGVCGLTRNYSVTNVANVTYLWSVPVGATLLSGQGTNAVSIQYSTSFVTGVISVVASNVCGNSNARTKTIYGKPSKPTSVSGPILFCISDTVVFSTNVVFGSSSYNWTVPSGLIILNGNGTNSITVTGNATSALGDVCVRAQNTCGNSGYRCLTVEATPSLSSIGNITGTANGVCGLTKIILLLIFQE
ncbi:MAG: SprB repeat-containing protein [Bacteroidetes bacterium]|nr:SprB repeat-containing protein [Bacteroidota bacterium]